MSIEKITSKITGEAEQARSQVLAEAQARQQAILRDAEAKARALIEGERARALAEKEKTIRRRKSVVDIDCRKIILQKKQDLIGQCFDKAADAITSMEEADYLQLLTALGKQTGFTEGLLIFNEKEQQAIGEKVAAALNQAVGTQGFQVSKETRSVRGGYLLQSGKVCINNTVEGLIEENRDQLSPEVAAMLFSE